MAPTVKIGVYRGKVFKPKSHTKGYLFVELSKNGSRKNHYVHKLVANAFIPNPLLLPQVNYLNGNKRGNRPENLERTDGP